MKRSTPLIATAIIFSLFSFTASAATTVKMVALKPLLNISLSQNPSDQISSLVVSSSSIVVVGTSAGHGIIQSFDRTGQVQLWSLTLESPESSESIATVGIRDSLGNIWAAGASSQLPTPPTPITLPSDAINPSGVISETTTALPSLTKLSVWKINPQGQLLGTFSQAAPNVILPDSLQLVGGKITVGGEISAQSSSRFSTSVDTTGVFSTMRVTSTRAPIVSANKEVKTTLSTWKSFMTSTSIKGIPSWKPKKNSQVLVRYDLKTKAVMAAYTTSNEILDLAWEKSLGLAVLLSSPAGYQLAIIK